jgi:hypothetical protein
MSERWKPKAGKQYWYWHFMRKMPMQMEWRDDEIDAYMHREGNVHATKEAAEAWGAAQGETKE